MLSRNRKSRVRKAKPNSPRLEYRFRALRFKNKHAHECGRDTVTCSFPIGRQGERARIAACRENELARRPFFFQMSLEIDWSKLDRGMAESVRRYLNDQFESIEKPDFLGRVFFEELDFGTKAPEIILRDITSPFDDFYDILLDDRESSPDLLPSQLLASHGDIPRSMARRPTDSQLHVRLLYNGDASMTISTELRINYPIPHFMVLPITLKLSRISFEGTGYRLRMSPY